MYTRCARHRGRIVPVTARTPPTSALQAPRAVMLPGTGSDADFVGRAFATALSAAGIELIEVDPQPRTVVAGYRAALDEAAATAGPLLFGGISLGAAVAALWALGHQQRLSGRTPRRSLAQTGSSCGCPPVWSLRWMMPCTRSRSPRRGCMPARMRSRSPCASTSSAPIPLPSARAACTPGVPRARAPVG